MASELEDVVVVVAPEDHDHEPDEPRTPLLGGQQVDLAIDDNDVEEPAQNPSHDTTPSKRPPSTERGSSSNSESPASSLEWLKNRLQAVCTSRDDTITMTEWKLAVNYPNFADHLFQLIDSDNSGGVTLQELLGALSHLTSAKHQRKRELAWFEQTFKTFAGDDDILQIDEFKAALKTDQFSENTFRLLDVQKSGRLNVTEIVNDLGKLTVLNKDEKWLAWVEEVFTKVAGEDRKISFDEFISVLKLSEDSFFAQRFFTLFDEDKSGGISLRELINGISILTQGSQEDKLKFLFQVYDADDSGTIDYDELRTVLVSCMRESKLKFTSEKIDELTDVLFEEADADNSGTITFDEFYAQLSKYPGVIENFTLSASDWLKEPSQSKKKSFFSDLHPVQFFLNNATLIVFLVIYFSINIVLFVEAAYRHRGGGVFVAIARGGGQCLNFNPVLLLILMMRKVITKIRGTFLSHVLPLDDYIEIHKLIGYMVVVFTFIHVAAHLCNFTRLELTDQLENITAIEYLFSVNTPLGWVGGAAGLTGWILTIILLIIFICALPCVRRKGQFEVFYWTHNLFVLFYIVLILHGPVFWCWFIGPAVIYIIERIVRSRFFKFIQYGRTYIEEGIILPSNVIHLVITRPSSFKYKPGDYIFINIPSVARYEWHPFTISSAPEQKGVVWLHIRVVGTWTKKLYELYKKEDTLNGRKYSARLSIHRKSLKIVNTPLSDVNSDALSLGDSPNGQANRTSISKTVQPHREIFIEGPYGTPSADIFEAEHAVLIGAGIGVTPFASILQSIAAKHSNAKHTCPSCSHEWVEGIPQDLLKLRKVDFFWINRDQKAFEWFLTLLSQLEAEKIGEDSFLSMHMYMTSALRKNDMKAIGLHMALDLIHEKQNVDLITGLQTRTLAGRPNWDEAFSKIQLQNKGKVTIFFCGPVALGAAIRSKCQKYGFGFRKENF